MKGIAESMLVLIIVGGLIVFLGMQVLGYGVPMNSRDEIEQDPGINSPETISDGDGEDFNKHLENLEEREVQLNRREEDLTAREDLSEQEFTRLEDLRRVLADQKSEVDAARQEIAHDREQMAREKEAIAQERLALDDYSAKLDLEAEQNEIKRKALDVEASHQEIVASLLREWVVSLDTEYKRLLQMKADLTKIRLVLYTLIFGVVASSLIYHLVLLRLLWVRGLIKKPLLKWFTRPLQKDETTRTRPIRMVYPPKEQMLGEGHRNVFS